MASGTTAPAVGTSPVLFPRCGNRAPSFNCGRILDSENLYVDYSAHATRFAVDLGHGHDGRYGGEGRRWPGGRGWRYARPKEFRCSIYWRLAESDLARPSHRSV